MSGECDSCGEHTLECICTSECPCRQGKRYPHLNVVAKNARPSVRFWINIRDRVEHEIVIKDKEWCEKLGLDQGYETSKYLNRWGNWLR